MTTVSQAVEKQTVERSKVATLRDAIERNHDQFAMALPQHVDAGRFMRAAFTALNVVPRLQECTQTSILAGLMQAAQLGLEVADVRGQAYLIPRNIKGTMTAAFQLGYRGMIDLAARGGITVDVDEVCANDELSYQRGTTPRLYHKPTLSKRGEVIAYYAVAQFADGRPPTFVIIGKGEAEDHRDKFAGTVKDGSPWVDHFDAMARKTVVKMLLNYLPATVELRQAVAIETTGSDEPLNVSYMPSAAPQLSAPEGVDPDTGEIDQPDAIETTGGDGAA